jgi:MtN3 and saliva related transmembrane protein
MDSITITGWAAAALSTASFAPQAWRIIQTRDTKAISLSTYLLTVSAFALWTSFGWLRQEWPLVVANAICLALSSFILLMKCLPQKTKDVVADAIDPINHA